LIFTWNTELEEEVWRGGDDGMVLCVPISVESIADSEVGVALLDSDDTCAQVELSKVDVELVRVSCFMRSGKSEIVQNPTTTKRKMRGQLMRKILSCKKPSAVVSVQKNRNISPVVGGKGVTRMSWKTRAKLAQREDHAE
jgi:hypothetical protein